VTGDERPNQAPERGDTSAGRPAYGGQRPAEVIPGSAADPQPVAATDNPSPPSAEEVGGATSDTVAEGAGPAAESAERFPPEAGREAEPVLESDPVAALMLERDDYRDALIRLQADFENYKKRMIKQQTDHLERAAEALVEKLLPVLDTADLALAHGGGEDVKQVGAR
jgi:molecular chaperone GrpE